MATQSPFLWVQDILHRLSLSVRPPAWALHDAQRRILLVLNHVLMQEPLAMERLLRQKGRVVHMQWRSLVFKACITPAGLLDLAHPDAHADLRLLVTQEEPLALAKTLVQGVKPTVHIEGDVQLAADMNWLVDHVRWDVEEDLARILGDVPAHLLCRAARSTRAVLRQWVSAASDHGADTVTDSCGSVL